MPVSIKNYQPDTTSIINPAVLPIPITHNTSHVATSILPPKTNQPMRPLNHRLSQRVQAVPPSGIRRFFDIAQTLDDVVTLGIGEPDFVSPPPILNAGLASLQRGNTSYTSNAGIPALREAVVQNLQNLYGGQGYDPESEVLITVGVSEAMYLIMQAILDAGDEVLVPQPCFVSYTASIILAGGTPVALPTYASNSFQLDPAAIEAAITPNTKALLIGFPSNPTGAVMDREGLMQIARIAEKHDLIVISDEIYDRLTYGDHEHIMFATLPGMAQRTIHLGGMSKDYAMTGWRIGYALGPADLITAMHKIHQYLIMSAPTVGQEAALAAFTDPATEPYVQEMIANYDERRQLIVEGVAVIPGSAFGKGGEGHIRCAYASSKENIVKALDRMDRFMQRHHVNW